MQVTVCSGLPINRMAVGIDANFKILKRPALLAP